MRDALRMTYDPTFRTPPILAPKVWNRQDQSPTVNRNTVFQIIQRDIWVLMVLAVTWLTRDQVGNVWGL